KETRQFFRRRLAFVRADANEKAPVASPIWAPLAINIERHDPPSVVESNAINERNDWRNDFFPADAHQFILNFFRMIDAFDAHLIVDAEDNYAATGVRQRNNSLRDAFGIRKLDLEFEVGVFTATHQPHQLSAVRERRGSRIKILLKRAFGDRLVPLRAAKSSASHLCIDGADEPARMLHRWDASIAGIKRAYETNLTTY